MQKNDMAIFDELKSVGKILQEAGKIEQYRQILDAQQQLLEMQKKINELEADNKKLREDIETKGNLIPENNVYWLSKDGVRSGPFCTCCWDSERKLMKLHKNEITGRVYCPKCNTAATAGVAHVFIPKDQERNSAR